MVGSIVMAHRAVDFVFAVALFVYFRCLLIIHIQIFTFEKEIFLRFKKIYFAFFVLLFFKFKVSFIWFFVFIYLRESFFYYYCYFYSYMYELFEEYKLPLSSIFLAFKLF